MGLLLIKGGVTTIALIFLCFWQIQNQAVVVESTAIGKKNSRIISRDGNPEDDNHTLQEIPPWTTTEIIVTGLATMTVAVSICTFLLENSRIVTIICVFASLIPPYTAVLEQKITELAATQDKHEVEERELENLGDENKCLERIADDYENRIANLQDLPVLYKEIREMENASLDFLIGQLKQSQEIRDKLQVSFSIILFPIFRCQNNQVKIPIFVITSTYTTG